MIGSWNAHFHETLAAVCDQKSTLSVTKPEYPELWNDQTAFSDVLKEHKIRTLLFAGVNTNQCVHGTLLDAYYWGHNLILLKDCCGTKTLEVKPWL